MDELRLPGAKGVGAEAELVREPGPQALDEDVGAVDEPQQHLRARGGGRAPTERLPEFAATNSVPSPPANGGPQARASSPDGGSTLTTSAPSAPSSCVQVGPAYEVVTSTTRTPASGANAI